MTSNLITFYKSSGGIHPLNRACLFRFKNSNGDLIAYLDREWTDGGDDSVCSRLSNTPVFPLLSDWHSKLMDRQIVKDEIYIGQTRTRVVLFPVESEFELTGFLLIDCGTEEISESDIDLLTRITAEIIR